MTAWVFLNSVFFQSLAVFITAISTVWYALAAYRRQKNDSKRSAASLILQEIRRAEDIISEYKEHSGFQFSKKLIATNSWNNNIHYFIRDLALDEIDRISTLYSTGEYLDRIIADISKYKLNKAVEDYEKTIDSIARSIEKGINNTNQQSITGITDPSQNYGAVIGKPINLTPNVETPWDILFRGIISKYEPIYHSSITNKLKKIAGY